MFRFSSSPWRGVGGTMGSPWRGFGGTMGSPWRGFGGTMGSPWRGVGGTKFSQNAVQPGAPPIVLLSNKCSSNQTQNIQAASYRQWAICINKENL